MQTGRLKRPAFLLLIALAVFPVSAGETATPALDRQVNLDLWGDSLEGFRDAVKAQTGVEVRFFIADFPPLRESGRVYLLSGRVPLRMALENIARQLGCRFRLSGPDSVDMTKGYDWVKADDLSLHFPVVDSLVPSGGSVDDARRALGEVLKLVPLLSAGNPDSVYFKFERTTLPDGRPTYKGIASLPKPLGEYYEKAVNCLIREAGDYPPSKSSLKPVLFRNASQTSIDWEEALDTPIRVVRDTDSRAVVKAVCEQAGIVISLSRAPSRSGGAPLGRVAVDRVGLGRISEELAKSLGLGRRVFLDAGGIAFEIGAGPWERDARSREFFWDGLAVAGFDVLRIAGGEGEKLAAALRRSVFPRVWRDPVCAIAYSPATDRLAVVAPENVVAAVAAALEEMERDGVPKEGFY